MTRSINRRKFLQQAGIAGSALAIGYYFTACATDTPEPEGVIELYNMNVDDVMQGASLNSFVSIDKSGGIIIMAHRPDMGQGTNQIIPLLIAEELNVDLSKVTIKQAPGHKLYGRQGVGGSATVRTMWEPMRQIGAAAREMLEQAAATHWNVSPSEVYADNGELINKSTQERIGYGAMVEAASQLEVPKSPKLKAANDFRLIGKSIPQPAIELKVRGKANYGIDMKVEGMVHALIERSPTFSSQIKSYDDSETLKIAGVQKVVKTSRKLGVNEFQGLAVIADSYWSALQGKNALKVEWEETTPLQNTESIYEDMRKLAATEGLEFHKQGNFKNAFDKSAKQISAQYETPFLAHAAMEPQNVLADVKADSCEIWAATQFPQWAKDEVASLLEMDEEKIVIHVAFLGGGFGRRALPDFVLEGVSLSKALGKPVKVVWTREDDMSQSSMRPGSINDLKGALDENGKLIAFQHKVTTPSIDHSMHRNFDGKTVPGSCMEPIGEPFYDVPNFESRYVFVDVHPLPLVWWRSVYSSTNVFGQEAFMDELAEAAGKDPMAFRLEMVQENQSYKAVLELLAEKSNWNSPLPEGRGRGLAITHCFSTTAGHVVEVSRDAAGKLQIDRVVTVVDCGIAVNPDNVKAQCEGCVVMGLTAALKDPITIKEGRIEQTNYHNYRMLRIDEMPPIEVHILPGEAAPTGVGEPALPPIAPALVNAIFNLTGKRIRKLPFDLASL